MKRKITLVAAVLSLATNCLLSTFSCAQTIAGGYEHCLTVCSDNTAWTWGSNWRGELGNGSWLDSNVPVQVSSLTGIIAVAGGFNHSLALKNDGTVWAWGRNTDGELGNGNNTISNVPVQVSGLSVFTAIASGFTHSIAVKNDGTVWAWGANSSGQLGNGNNTNSNVPVQVSGLTGAIAIAGGQGHSLVMKNDGTLWACGRNDFGQLGNGNNTDSNVPVQVSGLTGAIAIAGGDSYYLALKNDGTIWTWGGGCTLSNIPVQVSGLTGVIAIAGGYGHSLVLKSDGTAWAWGYNSHGQLGTGSTNSSDCVPGQVVLLSGIIAIAGGGRHSLALKQDSTAWAWGSGADGQLGNGNWSDSNFPVQVTGLCQVAAVNEITEPLSVSVFPNPATSEALINFCKAERYDVQLFNMLGEILFETKISVEQMKIDVKDFLNGIYFVVVRDGENNLVVRKIVKM